MSSALPLVPSEVIVYDHEEDCPYLPGRRARRPLRLPARLLTGAEFDGRLEAGDRRMGTLLYTQACPACAECEPIRVGVRDFVPSRAQRRVKRKGDGRIVVRVGPIDVDDRRVALFLAHERGRGLDQAGVRIDARGYEAFLVASCVDGFEIRYFVDERLVAVAITDRGERALSAVYTYWNPDHACLSLGTYSILTQLALADAAGLDWVYLGLAIRRSPHMVYKLKFLPHERRIGGLWRPFAHL